MSSNGTKHIGQGMKQPKKAMESAPAPAAPKKERKWSKHTRTKRSIAQIRKRRFMFMHKNFGVIVRHFVREHNGGDDLKIKRGVISTLQTVAEGRMIAYLKATNEVCKLDKNYTLMNKHLNIMSAVLGLSPQHTFGKPRPVIRDNSD